MSARRTQRVRMRKLTITIVAIVVLVVAVREAFRLQPTVYLMSTPAVMSTGVINPFDLNPGLEKSNEIRILFATNRIPAGSKDNRTYTVFPGDKLRVTISVRRTINGLDMPPWSPACPSLQLAPKPSVA